MRKNNMNSSYLMHDLFICISNLICLWLQREGKLSMDKDQDGMHRVPYSDFGHPKIWDFTIEKIGTKHS